MIRRLPCAPLRLLALFALLSSVDAQSPANRITELVDEVESLGVRCGVDVRILGSGKRVTSHRLSEGFVPASNQKILTAAHALAALGPDYEFRTRFYGSQVADGGFRLRVVSGGDPTLTQLRLGERNPFDAVVAALRAREVETIDEVVLDDARWSGPLRPADWPQDQLRQAYAAPTGPFVLEEGCLVVALTPTSAGAPVRVATYPRGDDFEIKGRILTTSSRKLGLRPIVSPTARGASLSGRMWTGFDTSYTRFADPDPQRRYVASLRAALRRGGITVRDFKAREATSTTRRRESEVLLHELRSPVRWSLRRLLVHSSNFQAEQLLRVVALEAGSEASLAVGRDLMARRFRGLPGADRLVVQDGSGLSRSNRLSPEILTTVLRQALLSESAGKLFLELFPRAGISGTISDRMLGMRGRVRAKTGWIRGASTLSGTVLTEQDEVVVFSILMTYAPERNGLNKRLKRIQDSIVAAIYETVG